MIITCNKCSTRFNLDDFLVKEKGSKVRCTVCKDIFTVYPLPREPEQEAEESSDLLLESDPDIPDIDDTFEESSDFELEESDFSVKDSDLEIESPGLEMDEPEHAQEAPDLEIDDDFSFDESELGIDKDDESQEIELKEGSLDFEDDDLEFEAGAEDDFDTLEFESIEEDEPVSFDNEDSEPFLEMENKTDAQDLEYQTSDESLEDDPLADDDEFELEFDVDEVDGEVSDILDDEDEIPLEIETESDTEGSFLSVDETKAEEDEQEDEEPPIITPDDDFSEYDEVLEQETEPEDDFLEEETIEVEDIPEKENASVEKPDSTMDNTPRSRRRKKKPIVGAPILIILLIFLLVAGAYIASIMTGYKIPYLSDIKIPVIEQYLKKTAPETSELKPTPDQKSVNGRFVTNSSVGTLFVITGRVENPSNIAYSHIEILGALITKGKTEEKTKNAFCGNIITEEMLKTGNISDINTLLAVKTGSHNANVKIKPGAGVPFMVVFSDLPEKLQNFTVKVINFEKAKND